MQITQSESWARVKRAAGFILTICYKSLLVFLSFLLFRAIMPEGAGFMGITRSDFSARVQRAAWEFLPSFLGMFLPQVLAIKIYPQQTGQFFRNKRRPVQWLVISYFSIITGSWLLGQLVMYLGIPKVLTFGVQVGRIATSSCEVSTPRSLPCFVRWMVRFVTRADGSWHLYEFERAWIGPVTAGTIWLGVPVMAIVLGSKEEREVERLEMVEKPVVAGEP